jgi:hypothetical protein
MSLNEAIEELAIMVPPSQRASTSRNREIFGIVVELIIFVNHGCVTYQEERFGFFALKPLEFMRSSVISKKRNRDALDLILPGFATGNRACL